MHRRRMYLLLVLLALILTQGICAQVLIKIDEHVEVSGTKIFLGDIAQIQGADPADLEQLEVVYIGEAPLPGYSRTLSLGILRMRLQQAKFSLKELELLVPPSFRVSTRTQVLESKRIIEVADGALMQALVEYPQVRFERITKVQDVVLPEGEIQLSPSSLPMVGRTMSFGIDVLIDGVFYRSLWVSYSVSLPVQVVAVKDAHMKHQVLKPDELVLVERDLFVVRDNAFSSIEDLAGYRVKRWILSGTVLTKDLIEPVPEVTAQQIVTLESSYGNVYAITKALSLEDGYVGDWIRVENLESGRVVIAEVAGPGRVISLITKGA
ncbi:MAG: flagellar basal body P-ring formation chaperone FlgA [Limnochordia bacterium]|nr:flagellar basal body P-ring formation chaperone FlgA [Limnochordia bacterium]